MRFQLLGPLSVVTDGGNEVTIGREKLRVLLAVLLISVNRVVPRGDLIDAIWADGPIHSARANLKTYIWALRRLLSPGDPALAPIVTRPSGYSIRASAECVDMLVFERLTAEARDCRQSGDVARATQKLHESLSLWRGSPLADLPQTVHAVSATAQRLDERRLRAVEELIDLRMEAGEHAEVIGELRAAVQQQPLREPLWHQLMLALYRAGRQADALAAYHRLRRSLRQEIGLEPSEPLQALHHRILVADPTLTAAPGRSAAPAGGRSRYRLAPTRRCGSWAGTRPGGPVRPAGGR